MKRLTRRDLLKTSLLAPAVVAAAHEVVANGRVKIDAAGEAGAPPAVPTPEAPGPGAGTGTSPLGFRLALSHSGMPMIPPRTSVSGAEGPATFRRRGISFRPAALAFDDNDWRPVDLPHDWAVELPFKNDPALASKGFYPLGRTYPATSVGWYRRVFELPARTRASGSPSSSTARTGKRWWSSTASTSAGTAADTIRSDST